MGYADWSENFVCIPQGIQVTPYHHTLCFYHFFATFKITPRMIKMLYLHIMQADSTENQNAFCKLIVLDNYKISKKSKKSVLRYIENITGSVGNFVKCILERHKLISILII